MLTESQFREIADSLRDIVNELKKANEQPRTPQPVYPVPNLHEVDIKHHLRDLGFFERNNHNFERSDHSGPTIA